MARIHKLSIIVSVYNEEKVLGQFYEKVSEVLDSLPVRSELIFVNDGSTDTSPGILERLALASGRVKVIHFSRNYGHEAAMIAGVDYALGDGIICMDADLQHPVECIPRIYSAFEEGYDVVTMARQENRGAGRIRKFCSSTFYWLLNLVSNVEFNENVSDFFGFTEKPARILREHYRESSRFLRAYVQNIGFSSTTLDYVAAPRAAGESKYSIRKLFRYSLQAFLSYSDIPVRIASFCGTVAALIGLLMMAYTIYTRLTSGAPSGYATIIVVMCFMFTILFFLLRIMGEYLSVILGEVRGRPIYTVRSLVNFDEGEEES